MIECALSMLRKVMIPMYRLWVYMYNIYLDVWKKRLSNQPLTNSPWPNLQTNLMC